MVMDINRIKRSLANVLTLNSLSDYGYVNYVNGNLVNIFIDLTYRIDRSNAGDLEYLSNIDLAYVYQEKYIRVYKDRDTDTYINGKFTHKDIMEIFKDIIPFLRTYNLDIFSNVEVGDFLGEYENNKLVDIHRVGKIYPNEFIIFSISDMSETDYLYPTSASYHYLIDNDYRLMKKEEVVSLLVDIDYNEILSQLHNRYKSNDFTKSEIGKVMRTFRRHNNDFGDYKVFRVLKDNKVIYNPFGNFVFSGHKKIILPKVI